MKQILLLAALVYPLLAQSQTIPKQEASFALPGGSLVIRDPELTFVHLAFTLINQAKDTWDLYFEISASGTCDGKPQAWKENVFIQLGYSDRTDLLQPYSNPRVMQIGLGCQVDTISFHLARAVSNGVEADVSSNPTGTIDLAGRRNALALIAAKAAAEQAKAEAAEKAAEDKLAAQTRAACRVVYKATVDKKVGDLTVRETDQINACKRLGYY